MRTEHILIIRFSALGDVAMTVPVIDSLARQYPDVRITMLSRPFARPFFEYMPQNVGFMEADLKNEYYGVKGLNALYRRLTAKNFTAIADFHSVLRSDYLRMRFNIDRYKVSHIDKHRSERKLLVSQSGKRLSPLPTSFDNYVDVLARLGYPVKIDFRSIFPPEGGDMSRLPASFNIAKASGEEWIGIAPNDVLIAIDGVRIRPDTLEDILSRYAAGDEMLIHAFRDDALMAWSLLLGAEKKLAADVKIKPVKLTRAWIEGCAEK